MMMKRAPESVEVVDEEMNFTLPEVCVHSGARVEFIVELVDYGVIAPLKGADSESWAFDAWALARLKCALRLHRDLEINLPGLAVSLDLLDEVQRLRQQVDLLDGQLKQFHND